MLLIKNGTVHIGDGTVRDKTDILLKGERIEKIGQNLSIKGGEILDASGKHIFPGFIDPASAIGVMGIPGRVMDHDETSSIINPDLSVSYSIDPDEVDAQAFYKSGITTIGLMPTSRTLIGGQMAVFQTAPGRFSERLIKKDAGLKMSVTEAVTETFGEKKMCPMTKMGLFSVLDSALKDEKRSDVLKAVFEKREMPAFINAVSAMEIQGILHFLEGKNVDPIIVDGFGFRDAMPEMLKSKAGLIIGNMIFLSQISKHDMDLSLLETLYDHGNKVAFTNSNGGWSEGREVLLWNAIEAYRCGVDAEKIVAMLSSHPAEMLGIAEKTGRIKEGLSGDLVISNAHLIKSYNARVEKVFISGREVL